MKKILRLSVVLFFLSVFMFSSLSIAGASQINLVRTEAEEAIECAEEYEAGNHNILQLRACLHHIRENINEILTQEGLAVKIREHDKGIELSGVKKILGEPNGETRHGWNMCGEKEVKFEERVPWWEKSIFSGNKIIITLNAWPNLDCDENIFYRLEFRIKTKAEKPDISECQSKVKSMAEDYLSGQSNGDELISELVGCESMASSWLEQYSTDCESAISNYFDSDEKIESQKIETSEIILSEGDHSEAILISETCLDCNWPWINARVEAHTHREDKPVELEAVNKDSLFELEEAELKNKFSNALSTAVSASENIERIDFQKLAKSNGMMDITLQVLSEKKYKGNEPPLDQEHNEILSFVEKELSKYGEIKSEVTTENRWMRPLIEDTETIEESWCQELERIQCEGDESCADGECVANIVGDEDCDNNVDDDGDGAIDNADRDCHGTSNVCEPACKECWNNREERCSEICDAEGGCYNCEKSGKENCKEECEECWKCYGEIECSSECIRCEAERDCKHECGDDTSDCFSECIEERGHSSKVEECKDVCEEIDGGLACKEMCNEGVWFFCNGKKQRNPCSGVEYKCENTFQKVPCFVYDCEGGVKQTEPCGVDCLEGFSYNNELGYCEEILPEEPAEDCTDGEDNDGDGAIDCFDEECKENKICKEEKEEEPETNDTIESKIPEGGKCSTSDDCEPELVCEGLDVKTCQMLPESGCPEGVYHLVKEGNCEIFTGSYCDIEESVKIVDSCDSYEEEESHKPEDLPVEENDSKVEEDVPDDADTKEDKPDNIKDSETDESEEENIDNLEEVGEKTQDEPEEDVNKLEDNDEEESSETDLSEEPTNPPEEENLEEITGEVTFSSGDWSIRDWIGNWITGLATSEKEEEEEEHEYDCTKEEDSCNNPNQFCDEESKDCRCEEGWWDCNGDWLDGCESESNCYESACTEERCAEPRCSEGEPGIISFGCYVAGTREEEKNMLRMVGTCSTQNGETHPHIHFDIWGEDFDNLQQLRHGEESQYSQNWCKYELEGLKEKRAEIETSLNEEFMEWFFYDYVVENPSEWDKNLGALWDIFFLIAETNSRIAVMNEKCSESETNMNPISVEYNSDFGRVKIYEEEVTADFGKWDEGNIGKIKALAPYMEVWIFPPKEILKGEFERAQKNGVLIGPENEEKKELSAKEQIEIRRDIGHITEEYEGKKGLVTIKQGEEDIYRILIHFNENNLIQVNPGVAEQETEVSIEIEYDFLYNVIRTMEKDMRGGEIESPEWAPRKSGGVVTKAFNGMKLIMKFVTAGDDFKTKGIGKSEAAELLGNVMGGGPEEKHD